MYSSALVLLSATVASALTIPSGTKIATSLFSGSPLEPSGLDYIPNSDLLVGASDEGALFFVSRSDPDTWWYFPQVSGVSNNWEGLTVDTGDDSDHLYIVYEGSDSGNDCAELTKVKYTLGTPNVDEAPDNIITVVSTVCLDEMDGKLTSGDGIESLTLYKPSTQSSVAEFLVGVQKTGIVWGIDATGSLNGVQLPATGRDRVSGSQYFPDFDVLLVIGDGDDQMQAIYVGGDCILETWSTQNTNEEGLVVAGPDLYIADDAGNLYIHPNFDMSAIPNCCSTGPCTSPISNPSLSPVSSPTPAPAEPTASPTAAPVQPTSAPTAAPTKAPVTAAPVAPTLAPTASPFTCSSLSRGACKRDSRCSWSKGSCVAN